MDVITILDKNINIVGIIDSFECFSLTRRFYTYGEFELKVNSNIVNTDKLIKNNLILINKNFNDICIILHREFKNDNGMENTDTLLIKGITLQGLVKRRLIIPSTTKEFETCEGNQETIMKYFVEKNCITPEDSNRKIPFLINAKNKNLGKTDLWRSSYENLADKLETIGKYSKLGWNIFLDHKKKNFIFDVMQGRDLTVNQNINPPVIFRSDFNNILSRQYIESIINTCNVAYVGGNQEENQTILKDGQASGFERIENFFNSNSNDINDIKQLAKCKIQEFKEFKAFDLDVKPFSTFIYKKDYELGDIVTIQDRKLKITMNNQIVEVKEQYVKEGLKLKIIFGEIIPNILTTIKRMVK